MHACSGRQGPEIRPALHTIVAEGLQSAENTVGAMEAEELFSNMKQLQLGILAELLSSLLEQLKATSSA